MTVYRLKEVEGVVTPATGLVDKIIEVINTNTTQLVLLAGVAGSGKTLTAQAVKAELINRDLVAPENIFEFSSINQKEAESIEWANSTMAFKDNIDDSKPLSVVIWDEVRYSDEETAAIAHLCNIGHCVIALAQETSTKYLARTEPAFKRLVKFELA